VSTGSGVVSIIKAKKGVNNTPPVTSIHSFMSDPVSESRWKNSIGGRTTRMKEVDGFPLII
jgi:hypothetical protein